MMLSWISCTQIIQLTFASTETSKQWARLQLIALLHLLLIGDDYQGVRLIAVYVAL